MFLRKRILLTACIVLPVISACGVFGSKITNANSSVVLDENDGSISANNVPDSFWMNLNLNANAVAADSLNRVWYVDGSFRLKVGQTFFQGFKEEGDIAVPVITHNFQNWAKNAGYTMNMFIMPNNVPYSLGRGYGSTAGQYGDIYLGATVQGENTWLPMCNLTSTVGGRVQYKHFYSTDLAVLNNEFYRINIAGDLLHNPIAGACTFNPWTTADLQGKKAIKIAAGNKDLFVVTNNNVASVLQNNKLSPLKFTNYITQQNIAVKSITLNKGENERKWLIDTQGCTYFELKATQDYEGYYADKLPTIAANETLFMPYSPSNCEERSTAINPTTIAVTSDETPYIINEKDKKLYQGIKVWLRSPDGGF